MLISSGYLIILLLMLTDRDLQKIGTLVDQKLDVRFAPVTKQLNALTRESRRQRADLNAILGNLDAREIALRKRVVKIEFHLGLSE